MKETIAFIIINGICIWAMFMNGFFYFRYLVRDVGIDIKAVNIIERAKP